MPLQTQLITLPFVKGVETKLDPKLVDNGSLLALENASFDKTGSLSRRDAWAEITGTTLPSSPDGICSYGDELLAVASGKLYSYSPAGGEMLEVGDVAHCSIRKTLIFGATTFADQLDAARLSGYACYVWRDRLRNGTTTTTNGINAMIRDEATGVVVFGPTLISSSSADDGPRVVGVAAESPSDAAAFIVIWQNSTTIKGVAIEISSMTATTAASIQTDLESSGAIAIASADGSAVLAYTTSHIGDSIYVLMLGYVAGAISVVSGPVSLCLESTLARTVVRCIDVCAYSSSITGVFVLAGAGATQGVWSGTVSTTATTVVALASVVRQDSTPAPAAGQASSIAAVLVGSTMMVYSDNAGGLGQGGTSGATAPLRSMGIDSGNVAEVAPATVLTSMSYVSGPCGPYLAGKPFVVGGSVYLPLYTGSVKLGDPNLQCAWFLWSVDSSAVVGKALYGTYGLWTTNSSTPSQKGAPTTFVLDSGEVVCPVLERGQLAFSGGSNINATPVGVSSLTLDFGPIFSSAQVGQNRFFAGGLLTQYDGRSVTEAGFNLFPEYVLSTLTGTGITGTFQYCALYEWTDNNGQRHQSAPSIPITVTATNDTVRLNVQSLVLTAKSDVSVVLYRTEDNGTTFYRLNDVTQTIENDPTAAMTANYDDTATDAAISVNEVLYTAGGELDHNGPGYCSAVASHQGRLWMVGLEDPTAFSFSQEAGVSEGLAFNEALSGSIPQDIGALTAVGVVDDKAILYTGTRKLVVFGAGPNPAGSQGTYSTPQLLPSDVGCVDPRSVVNVQSGQMYQSAHGLYLLNRALQDEYVGSPVEDLVFGAEVTSAMVLPDRSQARFSVVAPSGTIGVTTGFPGLDLGCSNSVLTYDLQFQQWATHSTDEAGLFAGACVWEDLPTYAVASLNPPAPEGATGVVVGAPGLELGVASVTAGAIVQDSPGTFLDYGETVIPVSLSTQWIRLGQLSGFERVRRLVLNGSFGSDSEITIGVSLNYSDEVVYTATLDSTGEMRNGDVFQLRHHIARQKCQAIKFAITDTPTGLPASGQGCNFSGITLELGMKRGTAKLPAAATV
jgi:hypothetical protein